MAVKRAAKRRGRPCKPRPVATSPHLDAFLDMLTAERGAAVNTRLAYERDLADLGRWLAQRGVPLEAAGTEDLRAYLAVQGKDGAPAPWRGGCRRCGSSTASCCRRAGGPTIRPPPSTAPSRAGRCPRS
ncbi:site-specific integrase [Azospirillum thiophilum]|uniref:site-specific integrase n=1 Tax=Azospirillum thiophilum TaxID=528244 RepID=UPI003CE4C550